MSNRASQFFGRKSVRRLTEESASNRNDADVFQGYTEEHPLVFDFLGPIDPRLHPTLATNSETHLSHRVCLNTVSILSLNLIFLNIGYFLISLILIKCLEFFV